MSMKRIVFLLLSVFFIPLLSFAEDIPTAPYLPAQNSTAAKTAPISVQYPYENMHIERGAKNIFLFGRVNVQGPVTLTINGTQVAVSDNGGFIAFLPVQAGNFPFVLTATTPTQTYQAVRHVNIEGTDISKFEHKAAFDKTTLFPQSAVELLPNDTISLFARATPHAQVTFSLSGVKGAKNITMKEDPANPGNYRAQYTFKPDQKPLRSKVTYKLTKGPRNTKAKAVAPAKIKVRDAKNPFTYARVTLNGVKLRKLPTPSGNLYPFYRAYGDVRVSGVMNNQYRLQLNDKESAWLEKKRLKDISAPDEDYKNTLSDMHIDYNDRRTRLTFDLTHPIPFSIREFSDSMQIILYGIDEFEESFSFDATNPLLERVDWAKTADKTYTFIAHLKEENTLWGHRYKFEDNKLHIDFMMRPETQATWEKPLKGARIVLDAGHNPRTKVPYDGAIGPSGYLEFQGTMALAEKLKPMLEAAGATVLMTRKGDNKMTLNQRYDFAAKNNAHIFVSLHYNALPNTTDPAAKPRGFTIFYAYPHSLDLAREMHAAFIKNVPLPDEGLTLNDVLFIPRISDFPSILVENAHLIIPEQEQMARTDAGQRIFVQALYEGIINFYQKQLPPPPPPKPVKKAKKRAKKK